MASVSTRYRAIWEASAIGLLLGIADINSFGHPSFVVAAYFAGGALLWVRHAGRVGPSWLLLGISLAVGGGMADHGRIHCPEDFRVDVGVEECPIHPAEASTSVSRGCA